MSFKWKVLTWHDISLRHLTVMLSFCNKIVQGWSRSEVKITTQNNGHLFFSKLSLDFLQRLENEWKSGQLNISSWVVENEMSRSNKKNVIWGVFDFESHNLAYLWFLIAKCVWLLIKSDKPRSFKIKFLSFPVNANSILMSFFLAIFEFKNIL